MTVNSPCIRVCCLDDDDVCLGCYRTLNEITGWAAMSEPDKSECLSRCAERQAKDAERRGHWRSWPTPPDPAPR